MSFGVSSLHDMLSFNLTFEKRGSLLKGTSCKVVSVCIALGCFLNTNLVYFLEKKTYNQKEIKVNGGMRILEFIEAYPLP